MMHIRLTIATMILGATAVAMTPASAGAQCTANGAPASCGVPGSVSMTGSNSQKHGRGGWLRPAETGAIHE